MPNHVMIAISALLIVKMTTGCATSEKIQVQEVGDQRLSCDEIEREMEKLEYAHRDINSKKGVTGTNVTAALFWLPGLAYTYYDAGQAEELINQRRGHLTGLYNAKNCGG